MTEGDFSAHPPAQEDRTVCQACGFPGNPLPFHGARDSESTVSITGLVYHPPHLADKRVTLTPTSGQCCWCGTNIPETGRIDWGSR